MLLGSGVALAVVGHHSWIYGIHKGSFIIWFGTMSVHVLGHLRSMPSLALRDLHHEQRLTSSAARRYLVAVVVLGGVVLAVLVYPQLPPWSNGFAGDR